MQWQTLIIGGKLSHRKMVMILGIELLWDNNNIPDMSLIIRIRNIGPNYQVTLAKTAGVILMTKVAYDQLKPYHTPHLPTPLSSSTPLSAPTPLSSPTHCLLLPHSLLLPHCLIIPHCPLLSYCLLLPHCLLIIHYLPILHCQEFLNLVQDSFLSQHVLEATRGENVLDIVLSSQKECVDNVKICEPLGCSDHNQIHFIIKVKGERNRKIRYRKKFHKGRYKDMREYLAKIDWNNTLKNKTATECWNILKSEIDCVVDKFVPLKKQGKRSKKKHLSKEAIRKIKCKQMMWKTYRHTGSEEDYSIYKEALNQATAEIRNSKRSYEQKIMLLI